MNPDAVIDIKKLKLWARNELSGSLREVILLERDELTPAEFLAKVEVWLRLLVKEDAR